MTIDSRLGRLADRYATGRWVRIEPVAQGTTSDAKLVTTDTGRYILRRLRDAEQGRKEYEISRRLWPLDIAPEVLVTKDGLPYVQLEDACYNLQRLIEHESDGERWNDAELGKTLSLLERAMRDIRTLTGQRDRFDLRRMWDEASASHARDAVIRLLKEPVERCLGYAGKITGYIHGDLGAWNLLLRKGRIYIIDFGEVRLGDRHFDAAAAIVSTAGGHASVEEAVTRLEDFCRGYSANAEPLDLD
ncbi:aminoglycoside phosphotransferase family protein [Paenibacillus dendritiformis]|uniref:aminoglycoside phosphotransferase family protein n=1 Tax=Paenibacillus dendritiformis TaxID=130049 RepID=UPI00387E1B5B